MHDLMTHEFEHIDHMHIIQKAILHAIVVIYRWVPLVHHFEDWYAFLLEVRVDDRISKKRSHSYLQSIYDIIERISCTQQPLDFTPPESLPLLSPRKYMTLRAQKILTNSKPSLSLSLFTLLLSLIIFTASYLFRPEPDPMYVTAEMPQEIAEENLFISTGANSKLVMSDNGTYTLYLLDFPGVEVSKLSELHKSIPMFNEKGEQIPWPFFYR